MFHFLRASHLLGLIIVAIVVVLPFRRQFPPRWYPDERSRSKERFVRGRVSVY